MEINRWYGSYKVRSFPWIDGKTIYFNLQYFASGQSICQPPVWDKSVYITDDNMGKRLVYDFTDTLIQYVSNMNIKNDSKVVITVQ